MRCCGRIRVSGETTQALGGGARRRRSTIGEDVKLYHENESAYVPIGAVHRLANPGKISLELIEVQVGRHPAARGRLPPARRSTIKS
jgi:mannose-6-phosphate isomerase-like protein (cupin superfamily)